MIGKKIGGRTYYYLAESARVDGKPRVVTQRYLGTADEIARAVPGGEPASARYRAYGDVAAVWATLRRLDFVRRVDEVAGPQRAKTTLGLTLAIAVLHRATAPDTPIADWWATGAAPDLVRPRVSTVEGFWRALERLTPERITRIEETVAAAVLEILDDHAALAVDVPQFAAFAAADCTLPSACQSVLAGVGLRVTRDGAIPLGSRLYRRDDGTAPTFAALTGELGPATLIFHTGQAAQLDLGSRSGFVGSLPLTDHPELLTQPASARKRVDPERFSRPHRTGHARGRRRRPAAGRPHALGDAARGAVPCVRRRAGHRDPRAGRPGRRSGGGHPPRRPGPGARRDRPRHPRPHVERVLTAVLSGSRAGEIRLERRIDTAAVARLDDEFFGKQVLVTDRDWPVAELVTAYRARTHLESTFRWLTGPAVTGPTPRWEWTRQRIAAHGLVSVLAATVTHLMRREADRAGMNLSVSELLERLAGIGELVLHYPSTGGRPRTGRRPTEQDPAQQALFALF